MWYHSNRLAGARIIFAKHCLFIVLQLRLPCFITHLLVFLGGCEPWAICFLRLFVHVNSELVPAVRHLLAQLVLLDFLLDLLIDQLLLLQKTVELL